MAKENKQTAYKTTYYRKDKKGDLTYVDLLEIYNNGEWAIVIDDKIPDEGFGKIEWRLSYKKFDKKIRELERKGTEIKRVDGAIDRVSFSEVKKGLALEFPKEKLVLLSRCRPERGDYYDFQLVNRVLDAFNDDIIDSFYLEHWINLYCYALQESFKREVDQLDKYAYAAVVALNDFAVKIKEQSKSEKAVNDLKKTLLTIDASRQKYLEKEKRKNA